MRILMVLLFIVFPDEGSAQILPGMEHDHILSYMNKNWGEFAFRKPPNADELNFLKFEHVSGDKTLIVFMSENDICLFTRLIVDIDYLQELIADYDSGFEPLGENQWIAKERGEKFKVRIDESEWMFTVTVREYSNIKNNQNPAIR